MSDAKQCDRCDEFYGVDERGVREWYITKETSTSVSVGKRQSMETDPIRSTLSTGRLLQTGSTSKSVDIPTLDLCPDCQRGLEVEIDGRTWSAVPDSWLDEGSHHEPDSGAPRRYATLAATDGDDVLVRYVHPVNSGAVVVRFDGVDVDTGLIPKPLCREHEDWPLSITRDPWADLERPGAVRHGERDLLWELHGDYLQAETAYEREDEPVLVTDGGQDEGRSVRDDPMKVGSRKTVRVSIVMDYTVEIDVPPQADLGDHADHELFVTDRWDDYGEKTVLNVDVLDEKPLWEDDFKSSEGWPSHV